MDQADKILQDMSNFDVNAILRGAQLTLVGGNDSLIRKVQASDADRELQRTALQNPKLFTSDHYRQAAIAVALGLAIRLIIAIPLIAARVFLWFSCLFLNCEGSTWDEDVIDGLTFIEHSVLQVPFFIMMLMRYITPTLDQMFMDSLDWVDRTYISKHHGDDPSQLRAMYYQNLSMYKAHSRPDPTSKASRNRGLKAFVMRFGRKAVLSLGIYALSHLPYIGRFVLPAASFYTFNKAVGPAPAVVIFSTGLVLPKRFLITFLQSYFSSRSLMRELLEPYFSRVPYTKQQKKQWFHDREGVLFGFAVGFFVLVKIPLLGVLIYGIAEASTAFLLTKITDPPPPPAQGEQYAQSQIKWENKQKFLSLPLDKLDALNIKTSSAKQGSAESSTVTGKFS